MLELNIWLSLRQRHCVTENAKGLSPSSLCGGQTATFHADVMLGWTYLCWFYHGALQILSEPKMFSNIYFAAKSEFKPINQIICLCLDFSLLYKCYVAIYFAQG